MLERQRHHDRVELALLHFLGELLGQRFTHLQPQLRILRLQHWQHTRQYIGRKRRNDAEPQRSRQQPAAVAREIAEILHVVENFRGAFSDFDTGFRQGDFTRAALQQVDLQFALEFANLHRERRLADGTAFRRPAEMAVTHEG